MVAVPVHLVQMKVKQLAEELGARSSAKSGKKRTLQLRLRDLIISSVTVNSGDSDVAGDE